jgi:hypothetical protein
MSRKCRAFSTSKLGLEPADNRKAFYAGWEAALAEPVKAMNKTPAWWMDGLAATLMREGVNKHRAKEIAKGYWDAYCQVPMDEEQPR